MRMDINQAGMRLNLTNTSWSEAVERLRSRVTSWIGTTRTAGTNSAHRRVCPGGCAMSFRTAPSVQHWIGWMSRSSLSKMPTWTATIVDLDASGVVQSTLLVESRQTRQRRQFPVVSKTERTSFFCEPCERKKDGDHGAEIMPKDSSRAVPRLTIW